MKKLIYCALAFVAGLFVSSCQQENLEPVAGGNTVTYTVELPGVDTKSIGDGLNIDQLVYEVWRTENPNDITLKPGAKTELLYRVADKQMVSGSTIIELDLVNDQNYTILFWAQVRDGGYYNTGDLRNVTLTNKSSNAFEENRAAFYGVDFIKATDPRKVKQTVTLTRPFGQVNLGTAFRTEAQQAVYTLNVDNTSVTVKGASTVFNVATGAASAETEDCTDLEFSAYTYVTNSENLIVKNETTEIPYQWISMNYVFVPANQATFEVDYTIETNHGVVTNTISNIPAKKNYRTNIVGNLLTSKTEYTVNLDTRWDGAEVVKIWDGETISEPAYNPETKTYTINNGDELAWVAAAVNGTLPEETKALTAKDFENETIVLAKNINLGGNEWVPIGLVDKRFSGTFDGAGHVIESFKITARHGDKPQAALFGNLSGNPTFKDLTIEKAKIVYPGSEDFYGAALIATAYGHVTINNVTVKDCYISGNNKVAGLLAHDGVVSSLNIDNCHVDNCVIESLNKEDGGNVGGLIGLFQGVAKTEKNPAPYGEHIIKNSSVKNTTINAINSRNAGSRSNGEFVACISGKVNQTLEINECVVSGNTFTQKGSNGENVTYVSPYGPFVGGDRNDDRKGTVIVDGKYMFDNGFTKEGNDIKVSNASHLLAAIAMVEDNDVIKLLDNVTFTETDRTHNSGTWYDGLYYVGDKSFTIDLGGKTISQDGAVNDYLLNFKNVGSKANIITIKNGTINAGTAAFCAICTSSVQENQLTINTENVNIINNISNGSTIKLRGGAVLNVNNGTKITGIDSYLGIECVASTVNIYDGAEIYMNGTTSYCGCLVGACAGGIVNVYGGEGVGKKGCFIAMTSGGTINVDGGDWTANTDGSIGSDSNWYVLTAQSNKYESGFVGGAYINVTGGAFRGGMDAWVLNNLEGEEAKITISGGNFNVNPTSFVEERCTVVETNGIYTVLAPVAKVGNTEYNNIDEAIANWTNGTTLTLLDNVTLSDVVKFKSTEHHILNLGTYTLTAASGQHAIEITCEGRSSASYALTVNADATNPGGITATGKSCIYYKKSGSTKDRPIILINNGVFTGSYSINSTSNGNTNCPQVWINGGVFNSYMNLTKNMLKISGGTFHAAINCTGDSSAYREIKGGRFKSWQFMTADALGKFWVGTAKDTYDVGVYVDDDGYLVVGGPVITGFDDRFEAKAKYGAWSSYLMYSSAADGLYYTKKDNVPDSNKTTPENENIIGLNPNKTFE